MRHLTNETHGVDISQVDYVLGCGEEGVGDRYQRAGGAMGKAMAALISSVALSPSEE